MIKFSSLVPPAPSENGLAWHRGRLIVSVLGLSVVLTGCAVVERPSRQPGYEVIQHQQQRPRQPDYQPVPPPRTRDTAYAGWRLFQDRCAGCHGPAATGTSRAPNLMPVMRELDDRRFFTHVLYRYEWGIAAQRGNPDAIDAMIEGVQNRRQGQLTLPAFRGEPRVTVYIADLYDYLAQQADRSQGRWRPRRQ